MMRTSLLLVTGIVGLVAVQPASANIIFQLGNNPQPGEQNVLFNQGGLIAGPALTVTGVTQNGFGVSFTGTENLVTPSAGQARVEAQDGLFQTLKVSSPGSIFTDVIFNLNTPNGTPGTATVTVTEVSGPGGTFALPVGAGSNFLTILATGGEQMTSVNIASTVGINDIRQVRLSGLAPSGGQVPEPQSLMLAIGGGLLFFGRLAWKKVVKA